MRFLAQPPWELGLPFRSVPCLCWQVFASALRLESRVTAAHLKAFKHCLRIVTHVLHGDYCAFEIMALYSDDTLNWTVNTVAQMAMQIHIRELLAFPKVWYCPALGAPVPCLPP